jgi:methionyl-tRNA formyltransferase
MKKMSKTVVFFGNERLATGVTTQAPTLHALLDAGYSVPAVITSYERGQSRNVRDLEIKKLAEVHNIPVLLPDQPSDITAELRKFGAEAAILVAYGKLLPQSVIDLFPSGIINIHPSLLPRHRGPTPIEGVLLEGADKTGVSLMQLSSELDAGPIYAQAELPLRDDESKQTLADQLGELGATMLKELLPGILGGSVVALPQDDAVATYDSLISKVDGRIDPHLYGAVELDRQIRAFAGWPKSQLDINGMGVTILSAHIEAEANGKPGTYRLEGKHLLLHTKSGSLSIDTLQPAGKTAMSIEAFLAGYKNKLHL